MKNLMNCETPKRLSSNLRFAAEVLLQQINEESSRVSLGMKILKTKIMTETTDDREIRIGDTFIETVDSYAYLDRQLKLGTGNQTNIRGAFGKLRLIFESKTVSPSGIDAWSRNVNESIRE